MTTVSQAARRLQVSKTSIRNYSHQLAASLSPGANPDPGGARFFSEADLRVMATAKSMLAEGLTYDRVRERLGAGVDLVEELPTEPEIAEPTNEQAVLFPLELLQAYAQPYVEHMAELRRERDRILEERDRLQQNLAELREELGRLRGRLDEVTRPWWWHLLGR